MEEILAAGIHWKLINFAIFIGLLVFFLRKPVKEFWSSRTNTIRFDMEEGEKLRREAQAKYDDLKRRVSRLESEAQELVRSLQQEGEMEKKRLTEEADKLAARLLSDGQRIMDQEFRRVREGLKEQAVQLVVEAAEKLVAENMKADDQKRLSDKYLETLERGAA